VENAISVAVVRTKPSVSHIDAAPGFQPLTKEHMENKILISFDIEQVAAALADAGFEASEKAVTDIEEFFKQGGGEFEDFEAAFRNLIADAATDLKLGRAGSPGVRIDRRIS
jgi:hypothetical protein